MSVLGKTQTSLPHSHFFSVVGRAEINGSVVVAPCSYRIDTQVVLALIIHREFC